MRSLDEASPRKARKKREKPASAAGLALVAEMEAQAQRSADRRAASAFATGIRAEWSTPTAAHAPEAAPAIQPPQLVVSTFAKAAPEHNAFAEYISRVPTDQYRMIDVELAKDALEYLPTTSVAFTLRDPNPFRCIYASRICFVDVDVEPSGRADALRLGHRFVAVNPEFGIRCYETAGGIRYMVTSRIMVPDAPETFDVMIALGVDAKYLAMCIRQRLFAARIDPKPERILPGVKHSVTRYLWSSGNPTIDVDALTILKIHDAETGAHEERPLA